MGDEAACLHREDKSWRRHLLPLLEGLLLGQSIEAVVDFNRAEFPRVPAKHLRWRKALRIKIAKPMFVVPAGGPNMFLETLRHALISGTDDAIRECWRLYAQRATGWLQSGGERHSGLESKVPGATHPSSLPS